MLVGAAALCWAIWRCRKDIIFNKTKYSLFIQAISGGDLLVAPMVAPLETVALEIANRGWKHNLRIGLDYFPFIFLPIRPWMVCFVIIFWPYTLGWNSFPLLKKIIATQL